jgi:uncharacterized protein with von Willebrand factor type A (vWA) domain
VTAIGAMALGRALREAGLPVTPDRSATFAEAAALVAPRTRGELYWAARLAFVTGRDQVPAFDAVFAALVDGIADPAEHRGEQAAPPPAYARRADAPREGDAAPRDADGARRDAAPRDGDADADSDRDAAPRGGAADAAGAVAVPVAASDTERLRDTRLDLLTDAELAVLARLTIVAPPRRARRTRASHRGEHLDVRATLRRSRRTAGDPVERLHRRRRTAPRPLVALLDVSGSMAPYARAYLLLLEGAARSARAETFVFATRLTRVTRALRQGRAHEALRRASAQAPDWSGGTRIGAALQHFNDRHGRRGMARGAVVVILSDGWERGDPALVGREMERLARLAHRIIWVNPRVAAPGFRPVTGGMAAALPHVDELVSGHSARALDAVIDAIGRHR